MAATLQFLSAMNEQSFYLRVLLEAERPSLDDAKCVTGVVFHALRDRLTHTEADQAAAQLPRHHKSFSGRGSWAAAALVVARRRRRTPAGEAAPQGVLRARAARGGARIQARGSPRDQRGVRGAQGAALAGRGRRH